MTEPSKISLDEARTLTAKECSFGHGFPKIVEAAYQAHARTLDKLHPERVPFDPDEACFMAGVWAYFSEDGDHKKAKASGLAAFKAKKKELGL